MKYAICNETFEGWDHQRVCRFIAGVGYTGLEIAPYTLAERITDVSAVRRQLLRRQADDCGIQIVGLHWLLARTQGLELTASDKGVRARTATYLAELARCCRDLGGHILVFGSPGQRRIPPGESKASALEFALDTLTQALPEIADCGVVLCLEPLSREETDFINTCEEGLEVVNRVGHPNLLLHLDVKAMASENAPIAHLIRDHLPRTGHFHANDPNRRGPGFGSVDFVPILRALEEGRYAGWISVEVFDYSPDPETIARESIRYLRECEARAHGGSDTISESHVAR
jgi:sugar phosphate isomerase/epimerase